MGVGKEQILEVLQPVGLVIDHACAFHILVD